MTRETFCMSDYQNLLDAIGCGGYRYETFLTDDESRGVVLLRHDIDKNIDDAHAMAVMEAACGIRATYLFLLRTPLYSLLEPESISKIHEISHMGHDIGLHCDLGRIPASMSEADVDKTVVRELETFELITGLRSCRTVSFHNPPREVVGRAPESTAYISSYAPRFMLPATKYISDSNALWREGDPKAMLRDRKWGRVQILVHPFWWASERRSDTSTRLKNVIDRRAAQVDQYLCYSNDLWREHRGDATQCVEAESEKSW